MTMRHRSSKLCAGSVSRWSSSSAIRSLETPTPIMYSLNGEVPAYLAENDSLILLTSSGLFATPPTSQPSRRGNWYLNVAAWKEAREASAALRRISGMTRSEEHTSELQSQSN